MPAPYIHKNDKVVLFDGVCKLCSAWARFLIRFDRNRIFKLATVQSREGQAILVYYGLPTDTFETMVYINGERLYTKSTALLGILRALPLPWPTFAVFAVVPRKLRDWLYDRIALNRYRFFGKYDHCLLPGPDNESRFIHGDDK
ncbi:thiol-disulfide oxidoreductase DCC family protein [Microbulbifer pacificus]|uniref:thiol-disulfide oxidoreductase DCC family protein n=1 Tax=Microbulbifer pacificus TaxID=407164 RepID=UPI00384E672B